MSQKLDFFRIQDYIIDIKFDQKLIFLASNGGKADYNKY